MKRPNIIAWGGAALGAFCAAVCLFCGYSVWILRSSAPASTFTVDEILASIALLVTLVGVLVAVAAIGIGMAALFGYTELRAVTFRKTEEQLHKIIANLQASGDLSAASARVLRQSIEIEPPERPPSGPPVRPAEQVPFGPSQFPGFKPMVQRYPRADKEDA